MKIHILNIIIIANFFFILYRSQHLLSNRKEPQLYCRGSFHESFDKEKGIPAFSKACISRLLLLNKIT